MFTHRYCPLLILFAVATFAGCSERPERKPWPWVITCDGVELKIEVATTPSQMKRGLMHRDRLREDWGMLFVYARDQRMSFWMKNTKVPLSIAFIDADLVVREIHDMEPMTEDSHDSAVAVRYALEVNRGWFARNGIRPGSVLKFSPRLDDLIDECVKGAEDGTE